MPEHMNKETQKATGRSTGRAASGAARSTTSMTSSGSSPKRASSRQAESAGRAATGKSASGSQRGNYRFKGLFKGLIVTAGVVSCLAVAFVTLYPVLREYYITSREHELLAIEYAAVLDRNDRIEAQIANLQTPEGIEDRAREQFGWVRQGEEAVNITGLQITESSTVLPSAVLPGSVVAESTWWTDFLDVLFDIDTSGPSQELYDPYIK